LLEPSRISFTSIEKNSFKILVLPFILFFDYFCQNEFFRVIIFIQVLIRFIKYLNEPSGNNEWEFIMNSGEIWKIFCLWGKFTFSRLLTGRPGGISLRWLLSQTIGMQFVWFKSVNSFGVPEETEPNIR
jgi:hypothetical protein